MASHALMTGARQPSILLAHHHVNLHFSSKVGRIHYLSEQDEEWN